MLGKMTALLFLIDKSAVSFNIVFLENKNGIYFDAVFFLSAVKNYNTLTMLSQR